jgi:hypothetical protein
MNRVRVQTWNFKNEPVDDVTVDMWNLDEMIQQIYAKFSDGWNLKKIVLEKVKVKV